MMLYLRVFLTCARNSLVRDMSFRANFWIEVLSSIAYMLLNLAFYLLIYSETNEVAGWERYEFFVFIATSMMINSAMQTFFMPNMQELSELVRTGGLDFALLKPIDTQFLVSIRKMNWASIGNFTVAIIVLIYSLNQLEGQPDGWLPYLLYPFYLVTGVLILYSIMITLAATSIWLGRNQSLYDYWFYITNLSRYPMEIYNNSRLGEGISTAFTFIVPILIVINVPARIMAKPLSPEYTFLSCFAVVITITSLLGSRWVFKKALQNYRSASS